MNEGDRWSSIPESF